jgi:hypothetical protein
MKNNVNDEAKWQLIKALLDEFPPLRERCHEYLHALEADEDPIPLLREQLPKRGFEKVLAVYGVRSSPMVKGRSEKCCLSRTTLS